MEYPVFEKVRRNVFCFKLYTIWNPYWKGCESKNKLLYMKCLWYDSLQFLWIIVWYITITGKVYILEWTSHNSYTSLHKT